MEIVLDSYFSSKNQKILFHSQQVDQEGCTCPAFDAKKGEKLNFLLVVPESTDEEQIATLKELSESEGQVQEGKVKNALRNHLDFYAQGNRNL